MLELLLKAHRPAKYKEKERVPNYHRLAGRPVEFLHELTDDQLIGKAEPMSARRG